MSNLTKTSPIQIFGVTFDNVEDICRHAFNHEPKDGIFVGVDCKRYPCFDSYDSQFENRYYCNFVFGHSQEEVDDKLAIMKHLPDGDNYNKLSFSLKPMIYWGGDKDSIVEIITSDGKYHIDSNIYKSGEFISRIRQSVINLMSEPTENPDYIYD